MNKYFAAFHSHFGAMLYYKALKGQNVMAKLMPTPRRVSSSCGTCVCYEHSAAIDLDGCELDSVYLDANDELVCVLTRHED